MGEDWGKFNGKLNIALERFLANVAKCVAKERQTVVKEKKKKRARGRRMKDTHCQERDDVSVRSWGFLLPRFVNMKFLWRSRKTYRAGCHVADFQFPARESRAAFKEEGRRRETAKSRQALRDDRHCTR